MKTLVFFAVIVLLSSLVVGQPSNVSGVEHSSLNLTTSFDRHVKDITWKYENNGTRSLIVKIKNGKMVDNIDDRFKLFDFGTVLSIDNLTKNDRGLYIADATFLNDTTIEKEFKVTVSEPVPPAETIPESLPPNLEKYKFLLTIILMVVLVCLCKCCKRSSKTIGQDSQKGMQTNQNEKVVKEHENERGNEENVKISVQETETQESVFIEIPHLLDKYSKNWIYPRKLSCEVTTGNDADEETAQQHLRQQEQHEQEC